jgi:hypothetical protein
MNAAGPIEVWAARGWKPAPSSGPWTEERVEVLAAGERLRR